MAVPVGAKPRTTRKIAGGFVLVPVVLVISAWRACRSSPLGIGDFRTWLACHEILARRCTQQRDRSPDYGYRELSRLTGVTEKRARSSVNRLVAAGQLTWSDSAIAFPDPAEPDDGALADSIGGGRGALTIPRRMLRLLVGGARPALIATALAILLRCLSRGRGGFNSCGRLKASWIARAFGVDLRRVKQARQELIALGWIIPEDSDQWAMNRWGRAYRIDLDWERAYPPAAGPRLPPPPATAGPRLPPPDLHPEPLRGEKHQEPAPGGPAGVQIGETAGGRTPPPPPAVLPVTVTPAPPVGRMPEPTCPRPAPGENGAGGTALPTPTWNDVRIEDLKDTGRLLQLFDQAVTGGLVTASEANRLRFVAAAEHARAIGTRNPPGLFARLVRGGIWGYLTQDDEDAASARLKRHLFGDPRRRGEGPQRPAAERAALSEDARLVREVRAALASAGYRGDPYLALRARDSSWTRPRWEGALAELGVGTSGARGARAGR